MRHRHNRRAMLAKPLLDQWLLNVAAEHETSFQIYWYLEQALAYKKNAAIDFLSVGGLSCRSALKYIRRASPERAIDSPKVASVRNP